MMRTTWVQTQLDLGQMNLAKGATDACKAHLAALDRLRGQYVYVLSKWLLIDCFQ